jgi:hypothetical protein
MGDWLMMTPDSKSNRADKKTVFFMVFTSLGLRLEFSTKQVSSVGAYDHTPLRGSDGDRTGIGQIGRIGRISWFDPDQIIF